MVTKQQVWDALYGAAAGDAVGVPYEFRSREEMRLAPALDMVGGGTYSLPVGTWSDDTSMILCTLDRLDESRDYEAIMDAFVSWQKNGAYTPYGECFDIGTTTWSALRHFERFRSPLEAGSSDEHCNGNGSLMRIIPAALFAAAHELPMEEAVAFSNTLSALTHAHRRSLIGCGIFTCVALALIKKPEKSAVAVGIAAAEAYYTATRDPKTRRELPHYARVLGKDFATLPEDQIRSSGYVVDTLECALWCLMNTEDYRGCILKAVNFGKDTDTAACVAGALAGLLYGWEGIPSTWREGLANRKLLDDVAANFCQNNHIG